MHSLKTTEAPSHASEVLRAGPAHEPLLLKSGLNRPGSAAAWIALSALRAVLVVAGAKCQAVMEGELKSHFLLFDPNEKRLREQFRIPIIR